MGRAEQRRMDDLEKRLADLAKKVAVLLADKEQSLIQREVVATNAVLEAVYGPRKGPVEVDQETKKHERAPVPPGVSMPEKESNR